MKKNDKVVKTLLTALRNAREALLNVPFVGDMYDQQHSDTHMRAVLEINEILEKEA